MNLVDSSAWLEYFAAGPQAGQFAAAIEDVASLLVPTIVLLEVTRRVLQQRGEDEALQVAAMLHQGHVIALDSGVALSAAQLGVAHKLPVADSIIYATAKQYGATVWTMDADFSGLTGVRYFPKRK
ncbi:MAG: type II toxin-antitoxin system VapC family toxin [Gemmatimonadaceae bacterium]|nr:type II toxin-antitoxin system VapC family toxin [Gemmatimonadaceae bacterium]